MGIAVAVSAELIVSDSVSGAPSGPLYDAVKRAYPVSRDKRRSEIAILTPIGGGSAR